MYVSDRSSLGVVTQVPISLELQRLWTGFNDSTNGYTVKKL
jgi:hypothetical protein